MEEFMFLGLRMTRGIGNEFVRLFGVKMETVYGAVMEQAYGQWSAEKRSCGCHLQMGHGCEQLITQIFCCLREGRHMYGEVSS